MDTLQMRSRQKTEEREYFRLWRDIADYDYIAARALYRVGLMPQFLWYSLQTIEKYLKGILLYSDQSVRGIGHDLSEAVRRVETNTAVPLVLSKTSRDLITFLNRFGSDRYFQKPYFYVGRELPDLDRAVSEIRPFCQAFNAGTPPRLADRGLDLDAHQLNEAKSAASTPHIKRRLFMGGVLEKIVDSKANELRSSLVWKNLYWGARKKARGATFRARSGSANPPHFLFPGLFDRLESKVPFSRDVRAMFRATGAEEKDPEST